MQEKSFSFTAFNHIPYLPQQQTRFDKVVEFGNLRKYYNRVLKSAAGEGMWMKDEALYVVPVGRALSPKGNG